MADGHGPRLVLWDIDHTLIESPGVGREIYQRVFPVATGMSLRDLATVHGRTELDIIHDTLQMHGIDPTNHAIERLATALADGYRAASDELVTRGRVLPGVWAALETFDAEPGVIQSVLTGNTTAVAHIKVEAFALDRYIDLSIGAYGDDHKNRSELVSYARKRAAGPVGTPIPAEHVVLIGDTPNDVEAALASGARLIGVATGRYNPQDLVAAGAELVLRDLTQLTRQIVRALLE